jgi:hypothetical protein
MALRYIVGAFCLAVSAWNCARAACIDADIEAAFRQKDVQALQRDLELQLGKANLTAADAELLGLSAYRLTTILAQQKRNDETKEWLGRSAKRLALVWDKDKDAEVGAVLSMIYGFQIGMSPLLGVMVGKRTQEMLETAEELGPISPRLHLAEGLSRFYRPGFLGGGADRAASEFDLAIKGFDASPLTSGVCWGRSDAALNLARAKMRLNERPAAMALIDEVVAKDPKNPVAQWMLEELRAADHAKK